MSLSLNIFGFLTVSHSVSEPRTLHLGSDSFSVLKSELVFCYAAALEGETVANPPCSLPHKGSSCKEETGWKVLRH